MVNKLHGVKLYKTTKAYVQHYQAKQDFFKNLPAIDPEVDEWESDDDLSQVEVKAGDSIAYLYIIISI